MGNRRRPDEQCRLVGSIGGAAHTKVPEICEACATGETASAGPIAAMVERRAADIAAIMRKIERTYIVLLLCGPGEGRGGSGCGPPGSAGTFLAGR